MFSFFAVEYDDLYDNNFKHLIQLIFAEETSLAVVNKTCGLYIHVKQVKKSNFLYNANLKKKSTKQFII